MTETIQENEMTFEQALGKLTETVRALEDGKLPLDKSLEAFETGVGLVRFCESKLDAAENRVRLLVSDGEKTDEQPFLGAD